MQSKDLVVGDHYAVRKTSSQFTSREQTKRIQVASDMRWHVPLGPPAHTATTLRGTLYSAPGRPADSGHRRHNAVLAFACDVETGKPNRNQLVAVRLTHIRETWQGWVTSDRYRRLARYDRDLAEASTWTRIVSDAAALGLTLDTPPDQRYDEWTLSGTDLRRLLDLAMRR